MPKLNSKPALTAKNIADHFRSLRIELGHNGSEADFFAKHLFVLNITFDLDRVSRSRLLIAVARWHSRFNRQLLGNHLNRKRSKQTIAYVFTDFEGSRQSGVGDITSAAMPHVHGLMFVQPEHLPKFNPRHCELMMPVLVPAIKDAVITSFEPAQGPLEDVISYCMKGYLQTSNSYYGKEDMWMILPR